jgi:hypothetical protein
MMAAADMDALGLGEAVKCAGAGGELPLGSVEWVDARSFA